MDADTISDLSNLTPVMRDLLYLSYSEMRKQGIRDINGLKRAINVIASQYSFDRRTKTALLGRIETIKELEIFGEFRRTTIIPISFVVGFQSLLTSRNTSSRTFLKRFILYN